MKSIEYSNIKITFLILIVFLPLYFQEVIPIARAQTYTNISVNEAYEMITNNTFYPDLIVLDVRTLSEYNTNHICNATLIPLAELVSRINELVSYNTTEIIVYCQAGGRSASASQILVNEGFINVFNMLGGISAWITVGYEVCPIENGYSPPTINFSFAIFGIFFLGTNLISILLIKKKINKLKKKKKFY